MPVRRGRCGKERAAGAGSGEERGIWLVDSTVPTVEAHRPGARGHLPPGPLCLLRAPHPPTELRCLAPPRQRLLGIANNPTQQPPPHPCRTQSLAAGRSSSTSRTPPRPRLLDIPARRRLLLLSSPVPQWCVCGGRPDLCFRGG
ncbi:LOW QUALITY PROTEIN: hypothetical protein U9M48_002270 [Paspalum notatum var. saurae]|uniref:Uncharacterized protein n=1 Tax=Paspalum notatum var. saurae TaxID=547442 RepID=A0AAQ3SHC1_PASNO